MSSIQRGRSFKTATAFKIDASHSVCTLQLLLPSSAQSQSIPPRAIPIRSTSIPRFARSFQHFYILDYEGSIARFETVLKAHPQDPMANGYIMHR